MPHGEGAQCFYADGDVQHLVGEFPAMGSVLQFSEFDQDRYVPLEVGNVLVVTLTADVHDLQKQFLKIERILRSEKIERTCGAGKFREVKIALTRWSRYTGVLLK